MKHYASIAITAVCAFLLGLLLHGPAPQAAVESPIATKDGKTFTLEDINIYWLRNLGSQGLRAYFEDMVLYEDGLRLGLKPADADIDDYIKSVMGPDTYKQFTQLYSERAVRQLVEVTLVNRKYDQYLRDKISKDKGLTVTEADARSFFLSHIDQYDLPAGADLSIITVKDQAKAAAVLKRLKAGEKFSDVAAQENLDPELRDRKGELGVWRKGDGSLPKPLEDAAALLKENQYSGVIQGQNCHILFCNKLVPEVTATFDDVKAQLLQDLLDQKIQPFYQTALTALMDKEMPRFAIQADLFRPDEKPSAGGAAK